MKLYFKLIFLLFTTFLYSDVLLKSNDSFILNENFVFELEAQGSNIEFPDIKKIDNQVVVNLGTSRSMTNINGNIINKIKKTYSFKPQNNFTLPSFEVKVDGKVYRTEEKIITQQTVKKSQLSNFDFQISLNKSSLYVGEEAVLNLKFKYKKDLEIVDLSFLMPIFNDIWSKKIEEQNSSYKENDFIVQELNFLISPQKSGLLEVPSIKIEAKVVDMNNYSYSLFSQGTKTQKIYSNSLKLDVKPLPDNVNLIGKFDISTSISREEIDEGESISYKVEINGIGNIEDISDIKLKIKDVTIFEDKAKIQTKINNNKNVGSYKKSFSIIANKDFEIPTIELTYFDKKTKKVVVKKSKNYKVKVKKVDKEVSFKGLEKAKVEEKKEIIKEKIVYKTSIKEMILFFIFGILFTILIFGLYFYVKNRKSVQKDDLPLVKLIKISKTDNEVIKLLLPYIGYNKTLDEMIFKLEKSEDIDLKNIKKEIIKIVESLNL
ncbi:MAG: BatD family protein [Arcobacter sp.]|uniref:BatD family protein n=1 Tax=Arcobacter sp. TaxID=1872629 RepID=UPI003AFFC968